MTKEPSNEIAYQVDRRPWIVYLMAIWAFFGISSYLLTIARVLGRSYPPISASGGLAVIVFSIFLIVYILQMRRRVIILFGFLCTALALWQSLNIINYLLSDSPTNPIVFLILYYIIPSGILAFVSLRPSFLKTADQYYAYREFKAREKAALKTIR